MHTVPVFLEKWYNVSLRFGIEENHEMTVTRSAGAGHCAQCFQMFSHLVLSVLARLEMRLGRQMANPDVNQHPKVMKRRLCLKSAVGWWEVLSLRSSPRMLDTLLGWK